MRAVPHLLIILTAAACSALPARAADPDGFEPLFDGRTFAGWNGDTANT